MKKYKGGLVLCLKDGESFMIGDNIRVLLSRIDGRQAHIAIFAPRDIQILRQELIDRANGRARED